jgi:hypothetical protein
LISINIIDTEGVIRQKASPGAGVSKL